MRLGLDCLPWEDDGGPGCKTPALLNRFVSLIPVGQIGGQRAFFWAKEQHAAASNSDGREVNHMSQHEHERKILDDLLSRTIEAEKVSLDPSQAVHLELLIGHIWHSAYTEKKRLDRQSRTEAQSQGRLLYRGSIVFASEDAASLKRALPDGLALQARLREIRETIKDAIRAIQNLQSARR